MQTRFQHLITPQWQRDEDDQRQRILERTKIRGSNSHFFFPRVTFSYLKYLRTVFFQESVFIHNTVCLGQHSKDHFHIWNHNRPLTVMKKWLEILPVMLRKRALNTNSFCSGPSEAKILGTLYQALNTEKSILHNDNCIYSSEQKILIILALVLPTLLNPNKYWRLDTKYWK